MYLKANIQNLVKNDRVGSEKIQFEFLYINGLVQGHEMTLTFNTHISSIRCLLPLTFRSLAAIVSEKSTVFLFSNRKA